MLAALHGAGYLVGINISAPLAEPGNWPAACLYWTDDWTVFCDQFPLYYTYASVTNFSVTPSPWADLRTLVRLFNEEYSECGVPVGCMGVAFT